MSSDIYSSPLISKSPIIQPSHLPLGHLSFQVKDVKKLKINKCTDQDYTLVGFPFTTLCRTIYNLSFLGNVLYFLNYNIRYWLFINSQASLSLLVFQISFIYKIYNFESVWQIVTTGNVQAEQVSTLAIAMWVNLKEKKSIQGIKQLISWFPFVRSYL